jgi:hypothetical protein
VVRLGQQLTAGRKRAKHWERGARHLLEWDYVSITGCGAGRNSGPPVETRKRGVHLAHAEHFGDVDRRLAQPIDELLALVRGQFFRLQPYPHDCNSASQAPARDANQRFAASAVTAPVGSRRLHIILIIF